MLKEVDMARLFPSKRGNAFLIGVDVARDVILFKRGAIVSYFSFFCIESQYWTGPLTASDKYEDGKIDPCFYIIHSPSI